MHVHHEMHETQLQQLRDLLRRHGLKPTTLAKRAGVSPSTVTRKFDVNDTGVFDPPTWAKLFRAVGEEPPGMADAAQAPVATESETVPLSTQDVGNDLEVAVRAIVAGRPHLSAWTVAGRGLDALGYVPGDVVVLNSETEPRVGDVVMASLLNYRSPSASRNVLRLFHGSQLLGASSEARHLVPIPLHPEWVAVRGVVEMLIRRPAASARMAGAPA